MRCDMAVNQPKKKAILSREARSLYVVLEEVTLANDLLLGSRFSEEGEASDGKDMAASSVSELCTR